LDDASLSELATLANVKDVYPMLRVPVEIKFGEATEYTAASGIPMSTKGTGPFQTITHGSGISSARHSSITFCSANLRFLRWRIHALAPSTRATSKGSRRRCSTESMVEI
jgi:hypothetical protein